MICIKVKLCMKFSQHLLSREEDKVRYHWKKARYHWFGGLRDFSDIVCGRIGEKLDNIHVYIQTILWVTFDIEHASHHISISYLQQPVSVIWKYLKKYRSRQDYTYTGPITIASGCLVSLTICLFGLLLAHSFVDVIDYRLIVRFILFIICFLP